MRRLHGSILLLSFVAGAMLLGKPLPGKNVAFAAHSITLHFELRQVSPPRSVTATVWYPTNTASGEIADGRFPVLLYFPGWGGKVADNASLLQSLARRGFVVLGLAYPEGAGLPDPAVPMQFATDAAYAQGTAQGNRMVEIESEDGSRILDLLEKAEPSGPAAPLAGHLDTTRAGVLGYSLGGCVAAQTALRDPRFLAVMNLDGWMFADVATQFFSRPYLVISDAQAPPTNAELSSNNGFVRNFSSLRVRDKKQQTAQLEKSGGYRVTIAGSTHFTFSDHAKANENNAGPISPALALRLVSAYADAFFAKYLNATPTPLLDDPATASDEVKLEIFPAPK